MARASTNQDAWVPASEALMKLGGGKVVHRGSPQTPSAPSVKAPERRIANLLNRRRTRIGCCIGTLVTLLIHKGSFLRST